MGTGRHFHVDRPGALRSTARREETTVHVTLPLFAPPSAPSSVRLHRAPRIAVLLCATIVGVVAIALAPGAALATAYFGDLHAHSALSDDATNPPDAFFRVARDVAGLDFVVLSDHDAFLTENEAEILKTTADSFDVPGEFVAFPGIEWTHRWHMNAYFTSSDAPYCLRDCPEAEDFNEFYGDTILAGDGAAHVNHPADLYKVDWAQIDDRITNAVEIWNTASAGDNESGFGNALWALRAGFRLGLVGVSDDHHSDAALPLLGTGLTGCDVETLTRESLIEALRARRCWATSIERIELALDVDGTPMGGALDAPLDRHVQVTVSALAPDDPYEIELLRNGEVVDRARCRTINCRLVASVAVREPNTFLYARVVRPNGARAWSSPVWVRGVCAGGRDCLSARVAPGGGGDASDDCLASWLVAGSAPYAGSVRAAGRASCTDGDRACDAGSTSGECTFRVGVCFAVASGRDGACAPAFPESFDVVTPVASTDRATPDFQNRALLLATYRAASERTGDDRCSALSEVRVPVGTTQLVTESRAGARSDRDVLELECHPARRMAPRLPLLGARRAAPHGHVH
jgi:hypothetical protein